MRRSLAATTAALVALAVGAQQPQKCVNPQMIDGLVFLGRSDMKVTVSPTPAFMKEVKVPADLLLIGAGVRDDGMTTVAYRTSLESGKAYAAVTGALGAGGWPAPQDQGLSAAMASDDT